MDSGEKATTFALPLQSRPVIHQGGLGEHGTRREETFFGPELWALHLYFWEGYLTFGGQRYDIRPHNIGLTPPDTSLTWHFPLEPCRHFFVHFEFEAGGDDEPSDEIPIMSSLGNRYEHVRRSFEALLSWIPRNRCRAEIALWDLLWELTDLAQPQAPLLEVWPGPVETAIGIIENELDQSLNAKSLAARVGLSYSQLNRLFKECLGSTLSKYITAERLKRADHLLRESNLPVKTVAELVGIPDMQHFNKFIRLHSGLSPRRYRDSCLPGNPRLRPVQDPS